MGVTNHLLTGMILQVLDAFQQKPAGSQLWSHTTKNEVFLACDGTGFGWLSNWRYCRSFRQPGRCLVDLSSVSSVTSSTMMVTDAIHTTMLDVRTPLEHAGCAFCHRIRGERARTEFCKRLLRHWIFLDESRHDGCEGCYCALVCSSWILDWQTRSRYLSRI